VTPPQASSSCDLYLDGAGVCGAPGARLYLPGRRCPLHTPAALSGRPEPAGQYPEPFPGAQVFRFRENDTSLTDERARKSGKRSSGKQRRAARG